MVRSFTGKRPVRAPLPAHLPRERVVVPPPSACPCCGGKLVKLGEDITETLEVVPRQWKVIQTVREKFTCRSCEKITQPPAPCHVIARARAGASLLAMILYAKFGEHQPLNRQSQSFAREGIELDVSTLADWVGACTASLSPLLELIRRHVLAAARLPGLMAGANSSNWPICERHRSPSRRCAASTRSLRPSARSTARRPKSGAPSASNGSTAGRRPGSMDARRTRPALAPCRGRQSDGLHAQALAGLHPLSRRRPPLPEQ
jgi:transposase